MSLAEKIRAFGDTEMTSVEIAKIVGCQSSYVRAVWQRERGEYQKAALARQRATFLTCNLEAASKAARSAYKKAIESGKTQKEANRAAVAARSKVAFSTYDKTVARKAWKAARAGADT